MFFWIAVAAWLAGVIISFSMGNRRLPLVILSLGVIAIVGVLFFRFGWPGIAALAGMALVIHIANKLDSV